MKNCIATRKCFGSGVLHSGTRIRVEKIPDLYKRIFNPKIISRGQKSTESGMPDIRNTATRSGSSRAKFMRIHAGPDHRHCNLLSLTSDRKGGENRRNERRPYFSLKPMKDAIRKTSRLSCSSVIGSMTLWKTKTQLGSEYGSNQGQNSAPVWRFKNAPYVRNRKNYKCGVAQFGVWSG